MLCLTSFFSVIVLSLFIFGGSIISRFQDTLLVAGDWIHILLKTISPFTVHVGCRWSNSSLLPYILFIFTLRFHWFGASISLSTCLLLFSGHVSIRFLVWTAIFHCAIYVKIYCMYEKVPVFSVTCLCQ